MWAQWLLGLYLVSIYWSNVDIYSQHFTFIRRSYSSSSLWKAYIKDILANISSFFNLFLTNLKDLLWAFCLLRFYAFMFNETFYSFQYFFFSNLNSLSRFRIMCDQKESCMFMYDLIYSFWKVENSNNMQGCIDPLFKNQFLWRKFFVLGLYNTCNKNYIPHMFL